MNNTLITSDVIVACVGLFGGGLLSNILQSVTHRKQTEIETRKTEYDFLREQNTDSLENIKLLKTNVIDPLRDELKAYNEKTQALEARILELNKKLSDYSQQLENIKIWVDEAAQHIDPAWLVENPLPMSKEKTIL